MIIAVFLVKIGGNVSFILKAEKLTVHISHGFDAIAPSQARYLILGSMPGQASLKAQQYYAHPRNAFWPIMMEWFQMDAGASYDQRCQTLMANGVMLWDVLKAAHRPGSLDSAIDTKSMQVNDFQFLKQSGHIEAVFCNGGKAYDLFLAKVIKPLGIRHIPVFKMPSTSPAHASMSLDEKKLQWFDAFKQFQLRETV